MLGDSTTTAGTGPSRTIGYPLAIFLNAFLVFQVQPMFAKLILPHFGGGAGVWSVCLIFFEVVLFLGYLSAHAITRYLTGGQQTAVLITLLVLSLFCLPIALPDISIPSSAQHPAASILLVLAASVGLPYFILSSTSPLLQAWHARGDLQTVPYRLFALSNFGSLLALLTYPFVVEPLLSSRHQRILWSTLYCVLSSLVVWLAVRRSSASPIGQQPQRIPPPTRNTKLLWICWASCASALLLAITNYICQNVAAIPLLWIVPLSLYLFTLIVCFERRGWYKRGATVILLIVSLAAMAFITGVSRAPLPALVTISVFCLGLFAFCMVCHGELSLLSPHAQHLTSFYLYVSFGGAAGAIFAALIAPAIFSSGYYEVPFILGCCGLLLHAVLRQRTPARAVAIRGYAFRAALLLALCVGLPIYKEKQDGGIIVSARNFFGVLKVKDLTTSGTESDRPVPYRELVSGSVVHGTQFLNSNLARNATTYYGPTSGAALALEAAGKRGPVMAGIIGLGIGTLATYGREGDSYTFYEINPLVAATARSQFSFLRDSPAQNDVIVGDGRLLLMQNSLPRFDVLVVDAFSGDAIPTHLLTREAFALYLKRMKPGGLIAVHVTNRYLDLAPVVLAAAADLDQEARVVNSSGDIDDGIYPARWVLVGGESALEAIGPDRRSATLSRSESRKYLWADDYSSVLRVSRW